MNAWQNSLLDYFKLLEISIKKECVFFVFSAYAFKKRNKQPIQFAYKEDRLHV